MPSSGMPCNFFKFLLFLTVNFSNLWCYYGTKQMLCLIIHCGIMTPYGQGSDQFMNWIGIDNQFNSIQHELNWNWIERFWIGIESELKTWTDRNWSIQSIHFQFNSSFYKVKHFLYAILWKLQCDKQPHVSKHTHMLHCVFPVWGLQGSLDIKGWPLHQLFWDISSALTH